MNKDSDVKASVLSATERILFLFATDAAPASASASGPS
jgi:hypothetical protein